MMIGGRGRSEYLISSLVNSPTDSELVHAARSGHKEAFGLLLERHSRRAFGLAMHMVQHRETAQELAQEAMVESYLSLQSLRQPERFASWLYGIVLNVCRSYLRSRSADHLSLEAMAGGLAFDALPFADKGPDPYEMVEMSELRMLVLEAVHGLSPKNREATLLFYYEQLSVREIASLLDISVVAVKGRLHKARQQLRERLMPVYGELGRPLVREQERIMVQVTVADVIHQPDSGHYIVILLDKEGWRFLPIWVGDFEGNAIAMQLLDHATARPLTYAFMANLLDATGMVLEEVRVESLREITFYAVAKLRSGANTWEVDARPSDAIALALHKGSPIYVAEEIMAKIGEAVPEAYRTSASGKGLEQISSELVEKRQEQERKLQEAKSRATEQTPEEQMEARQKLLVSVFGGMQG